MFCEYVQPIIYIELNSKNNSVNQYFFPPQVHQYFKELLAKVILFCNISYQKTPDGLPYPTGVFCLCTSNLTNTPGEGR